jgi:hypothetical protein
MNIRTESPLAKATQRFMQRDFLWPKVYTEGHGSDPL